MGRESRRPKPPEIPPQPQPLPSEKDKARQAVQQLDAVTAKMNMPRETHAACQMASQFLLEFIEKAKV